MAHQQVTMDDLEFILRLNLQTELVQAALITGPPGTAKTALMRNLLTRLIAEVYGIREEDICYKEFRVTGKDAVEFAGYALPVKLDGQMLTQYTVPPLKTTLDQLCSEWPFVLINFDEIMQADTPMWNVLSDVLNCEQHTIGDWELPKNCFFCGTGNRLADKSGSKRAPSHIVDRCLILELLRDVDGWQRNYAVPNNVNPIIRDCVDAYADKADFFADAVPAEDTSFCTLRSITQVARQFDAYLANYDFDGTVPPKLEKMFAATIGAKAACTVAGYISQHDKVPTGDQILANPMDALVPDQTGYQALAGNIALAAAFDADSGEQVIQYLCRLRPDLQVSLATKLLKFSAKRGWSVGGPLAQAFIEKYHDLLGLTE